MGTNTQPEAAETLEFTGERFTPECVREIFYEHWHRYAWAGGYVAGLDVLDCACGEGYGSRLLAESARSVIGADLDETTIAHAGQRYLRDNLDFRRADALALPFEDQQFDCIVSFETLEHLAAHDDLLAGFKRILKPGGFVLLSSPDRKTYSDDTGYDNPYHVRELYREEFESLLGRHLPNFRLYGQKLMFHSALWRIGNSVAPESHDSGTESLVLEDDGQVHRSNVPIQAPVYYLAVAAAEGAQLPQVPALSLFADRAESVYAHYDDVVRKHILGEQRIAEQAARIAHLETLKIPLWTRLLSRFRSR